MSEHNNKNKKNNYKMPEYESKYSRGKDPVEAMHERRRNRRRTGGGGGGRRHGGPMGMPAEKAKDFKGSLLRVVKYMKPFWIGITALALISIVTSLFSVISPRIQGNAISLIEAGVTTGDGINYTALYRTLLLLGALFVSRSLFNLVQHLISATVSQRLVYNFRRDVEAKLSKLPLKYYDSNTHGEILSRMVNDVDTVSSTLQMSISSLISNAITLVGVLFMMLSISPLMTLIALAFTPFYIIVVYVIAPKSQRYFIAQQTALGDLNSHVEEMFTGHKIVKVFNHEDESIEEFNYINNQYYTFSRRAQFISGMIMPIMQFLGNLGYVTMCIMGALSVAAGRINLGDMQAFMQYVRLFNQPISQTSNIANVIQSTVASAERIFDILDEIEEIPETSEPQDLESPIGEVAFEHIRFGYSEDKILMDDMSLAVKPGQTAAVVGPTGAGKTTLVNLLMRFYDVMDGRIAVDGVDIRNMTRGGLRSIFGMVLQDTWLFNGTIKDNILYGRTDATDDEIIQAAVAARADHFIRTLPDGYDTEINEEASNISQGQKQLLTIARAFLANPSILILDEATSSVDTRTEVLIQEALARLQKGRTSFVIAHRLSTIRNADIILVMDDGDIIEKGSHDELMAAQGFYCNLYNSQFMNAAENQAV